MRAKGCEKIDEKLIVAVETDSNHIDDCGDKDAIRAAEDGRPQLVDNKRLDVGNDLIALFDRERFDSLFQQEGVHLVSFVSEEGVCSDSAGDGYGHEKHVVARQEKNGYLNGDLNGMEAFLRDKNDVILLVSHNKRCLVHKEVRDSSVKDVHKENRVEQRVVHRHVSHKHLQEREQT